MFGLAAWILCERMYNITTFSKSLTTTDVKSKCEKWRRGNECNFKGGHKKWATQAVIHPTASPVTESRPIEKGKGLLLGELVLELDCGKRILHFPYLCRPLSASFLIFWHRKNTGIDDILSHQANDGTRILLRLRELKGRAMEIFLIFVHQRHIPSRDASASHRRISFIDHLANSVMPLISAVKAQCWWPLDNHLSYHDSAEISTTLSLFYSHLVGHVKTMKV